jgi:hypothetical protein
MMDRIGILTTERAYKLNAVGQRALSPSPSPASGRGVKKKLTLLIKKPAQLRGFFMKRCALHIAPVLAAHLEQGGRDLSQ